MDDKPKPMPLSNHPDLLNIDVEYAENLKILLESSPFKGFVKSKVAAMTTCDKNDCHCDADGFASSSSKENLSVPRNSIPKENSPYNYQIYDPKIALGENATPDMTFDHPNNASFVQDAVRAYHTDFFQLKQEDIHGNLDLTTSAPISNPVPRSNSPRKRSLSARIQSLLNNFESINHQNDSPIGFSSDLSRVTGKQRCKMGSLGASFSDTRSMVEACFVCNKVIYPLDRFSTGFHVYHKSCLRCSICDRSLSSATCESAKDELFCRTHFLEKAHGISRRIPTLGDCQNSSFHSITVE